MRAEDLTDRKFGEWTVLSHAGRSGKRILWLCRCSCGTEKPVQGDHLKGGRSKTCGAIVHRKDTHLVHGHTRKGQPRHPLYATWLSMKDRCYNPANVGYKNYGGRGIYVCARWVLSFQSFIDDVGERPSRRHSIDRINNDGPYAPENCRWVTQIEQGQNLRKNVHVDLNGETVVLAEAARRLSLRYGWLRHQVVERSIPFETVLENLHLKRSGARFLNSTKLIQKVSA